MDKALQQRRLLEIGAKIIGLPMKVMDFRLKAGLLQTRTDIVDADKKWADEMGARLQKQLEKVIEANDQQPGPSEVIEHFIAGYDRMTEELESANKRLDAILAKSS